jgi:hypothetical protein
MISDAKEPLNFAQANRMAYDNIVGYILHDEYFRCYNGILLVIISQ